MTEATLWIPRGLPASGKSTWAREMIDRQPLGSIVRLNRDDIRAMMFGHGYRQPRHEAEQLVSKVEHGPIGALLRAGSDVIVDDTNLRTRFVKDLMQIAVKAGARCKVMDDFLDVPVETCIARDADRLVGQVGETVIMGMHNKFLSGGRRPHVPELDEVVTGKPYVPVEGTPLAVMVDIDGTVALHTGVRGPYDTSLYHLDKPNWNIVNLIRREFDAGLKILFCSGRDEEFFTVTTNWIFEHVFGGVEHAGFDLFMRPAGDVRNDAIVKLELFDKHIREEYDVVRVYDDRDRVVKAWRSIGLTVLQVADGNF